MLWEVSGKIEQEFTLVIKIILARGMLKRSTTCWNSTGSFLPISTAASRAAELDLNQERGRKSSSLIFELRFRSQRKAHSLDLTESKSTLKAPRETSKPAFTQSRALHTADTPKDRTLPTSKPAQNGPLSEFRLHRLNTAGEDDDLLECRRLTLLNWREWDFSLPTRFLILLLNCLSILFLDTRMNKWQLQVFFCW